MVEPESDLNLIIDPNLIESDRTRVLMMMMLFISKAAAQPPRLAPTNGWNQANSATQAKPAAAGPPSRIYVGSVYFEIGEEEIKQVTRG